MARIELGSLNYQQEGRYNGKAGGVIAIFQTPGSNALQVGEGIKSTMAGLKNAFPGGLDYEVALDTTLPIVEGMHEIVKTLFEAMVLVIIVVFIFLQSWRATLIPLLAVPVSLVGTFAVFPLLGFSLNTLSLFGLILAIGLVVDDAIVVVEAVEHHIDHGLSPMDATLKAMQEVTGPGHRHRAGPLRGVHPGRLHRRHHRPAVPAVRADHRHLGADLGLQRADPQPGALGAAPQVQAARQKGLMVRFGGWFNAWFDRMTGGYVKISAGLVRKMVLSLGLLGRWPRCWPGSLGREIPSGFVPDRGSGLRAGLRSSSPTRPRCSGPARWARRSRRSWPRPRASGATP